MIYAVTKSQIKLEQQWHPLKSCSGWLKLNGCVCVKWVFSPPGHPVSLLVGEPGGGGDAAKGKTISCLWDLGESSNHSWMIHLVFYLPCHVTHSSSGLFLPDIHLLIEISPLSTFARSSGFILISLTTPLCHNQNMFFFAQLCWQFNWI